MRRAAMGALVLLMWAAGTAAGHPPPDDFDEPTADITLVEWSTWLRGGLVVAHGSEDPDPARTVTSPPHEREDSVATAFGGGFTLPMGRRMRLGAYAELRDWGMPVVGGELTLLGKEGNLDLFWYDGTAAVTLRAGANHDVRTAQLNLAYRAPWNLFGNQPRWSRYMIGAAVVMTATQSRFDPNDWSMTWAIEFEPIGALRYVLGIKSWY